MVKIKGENKQSIEINVKELTLRERGEFNNLYHKAELSDPLDWLAFAECCILASGFSESKLNEFTDIEIIMIAKECYFALNKKKLKK